jgi:hypothetical protein
MDLQIMRKDGISVKEDREVTSVLEKAAFSKSRKPLKCVVPITGSVELTPGE